MKYEVEISAHAEAEIEQVYLYIYDDAPDRAVDWRLRLYHVAATLEEFPERCPFAPENIAVAAEIRQLLYGEYRILFTVAGSTVYILHVRHRARRYLRSADL